MTYANAYPVGTAGQPWGEAERDQWRARQSKRRSYAEDVVRRIEGLGDRFERIEYGRLEYGGEAYALWALRSREWSPGRPAAFITGGVHGYETSGVTGAIEFLESHASDYEARINLLVAPCVSPWGYERINRWNYDAVDPNRSFRLGGPSREANAVIELIEPYMGQFLMHIDLHETTDSDESEFRPALAARDGKPFERGSVPDGFYLVADQENHELEFQRAIIAAVETVTHIAPADRDGEIIGCPVLSHGVIAYPVKAYGMCPSISDARYTTTTEVYPDSPKATLRQCNEAQIAAVRTALDFVLAGMA